MIFTKLRLENFGLFYGRHELDLEPSQKWGKHCPIVLFGGKNGAGKTTILEAIMLCVHGRRSLGDRVTEGDYTEYLRGRIHRPRGGDSLPVKRASVSLEFRQTHFGVEQEYHAERVWKVRNDKVEESLVLERVGVQSSRNGSDEGDEILEGLSQDFLDDLFPVGIAKLFFFDGEKIQELAQDEEKGERLGVSIKEMLNLDIVERLQADLKTHLLREKRKSQSGDVTKGLAELEAQLEKMDVQRSQLRQELAGIETRRTQKLSEVAQEEQSFRAEGGAYAARLGELQEGHGRTQAELDAEAETIRTLSAGLLPFALVPELCVSLVEQVEKERGLRRWVAGKDALLSVADTAAEELTRQLKMDERSARRAFEVIVDAVSGPADLEGFSERHRELSDRETEDILGWLRTGVIRAVKDARRSTKGAESLTKELSRLAEQINKAPDEDIASERLASIKRLTSTVGELEQEKRSLQGRLQELDSQREQAGRQHEKIVLGLRSSKDAVEKEQLSAKVERVLERFGAQLSAMKVSQLESEAVAALASLHRKEDVIRGMKIDPDTFAVTLLGKANRVIPKKELSAGEKQMYAVAMLWALARTSGRPLPVVIDTPLGRLDSDHRRNLVDNYFPKASHQVIILSTDTEVDSTYFEDLRKYVARSYHLKYNSLNMETEVEEGYFWTSHKEDSDDTQQDERLLGSLGAS